MLFAVFQGGKTVVIFPKNGAEIIVGSESAGKGYRIDGKIVLQQ